MMPKPKPKTEEEFVRKLRIAYDGFPPEGKNLTWDEFRNQALALVDPQNCMDDLGDLQLIKARQRMNKMRIDRGLKKVWI